MQIRRLPGESLVKAAERIANGSAPHVMFGVIDRSRDREKSVHNFYQEENRCARIVEIFSGESSENDGEVYLTAPRPVPLEDPYVQNADRTVPSTRTARKHVFDGVYPPRRDMAKARPVRDLQDKTPENGGDTRGKAERQVADHKQDTPSADTEQVSEKSRASKEVRSEGDSDVEMRESRKDRPERKGLEKRANTEEGKTLKEAENAPSKIIGRQSELTATVDKQRVSVMDAPRDFLETNGGVESKTQEGSIKGRATRMDSSLHTAETSNPRGLSNLTTPELIIQAVADSLWILRELVELWMTVSEKSVTENDEDGSTSQERKEYKNQQEESMGSRRSAKMSTGILSPPLILPRPPTPPLANMSTHPLTAANAALHSIQHLSQERFHEPHRPDVHLVTNNPHESNTGHNIDPTFAAAPQSEYYGSVVLPDGQVAHQHVALNILRVFKNRETLQPYSVQGHEFSVLLEAPPAGVTWTREVWYPSDPTLRNEMARFMPNDPPQGDDPGFPTHAVKEAPAPPPTLVERLQARMKCYFPETVAPNQTYRNYATPEEIAKTVPAERMMSDSAASRSEPSSATTDASIGLSGTNTSTAVDDLTRDIEQCAEKVLKLGVEGEDEEDYGPPPLLWPMEQPVGLEEFNAQLCTVCFGPEHDLADCPQIVNDSGAPLESPKPPGLYFFEDDVIVGSDLIPPAVVAKQPAEVQHFLHSALGPTLDVLINLTMDEVDRYNEIMRLATKVHASYKDLEAKMEATKIGASCEAAKRLLRELNEAIKSNQTALEVLNTATDPLPTLDNNISHMVFAGMALPVVVPLEEATTAPLTEAALASHTEQLAAPTFNLRSGNPISHDTWSSSTSVCSSTSDEDENLYRSARNLGRPTGYSTPAVTEWIEAQAPERETPGRESLPPSSATDASYDACEVPLNAVMADNSSPEPLSSDSASNDAPGNPFPSQCPDVTSTEQLALLEKWIQDENDHQDAHFSDENEICGAPLRLVVHALHGDLSPYLDYPSMAADADARLEILPVLSPFTMDFRTPQGATTASPDPTQSPTSLDFSLPTPPATSDGTMNGETNTSGTSEDSNEGSSSGKRKSLSDERIGEFQEGPRKRFPTRWSTTGYSGRRASLGGAGLAQRHFPVEFIRHPLLFDVEAAKLHTIYSVLHKHHRYELATLLRDVLTIRFKNEFAMSHVLNAHFLEGQYPAAYHRYWELLPIPESANYVYDESSTSDASSDESESGWNAYDLQYPPNNGWQLLTDQEPHVPGTAVSAPIAPAVAEHNRLDAPIITLDASITASGADISAATAEASATTPGDITDNEANDYSSSNSTDHILYIPMPTCAPCWVYLSAAVFNHFHPAPDRIATITTVQHGCTIF
ncbi:hypothetical protein FB451DRAFT_1168731 [Mycena latifolia]|nr:hypothetical protein FB451DRAFT_1168731 [Mycena latifolia]